MKQKATRALCCNKPDAHSHLCTDPLVSWHKEIWVNATNQITLHCIDAIALYLLN